MRLANQPDGSQDYLSGNDEDHAVGAKLHSHKTSLIRRFEPAGMLEEEDGENWGQSTRGMVGAMSNRYPLHFAMAIGHGEIIRDELSPPRIEGGPPHVESGVNEHPQLWHYRAWSEWMASENWDELRAIHSRVPEDRV